MAEAASDPESEDNVILVSSPCETSVCLAEVFTWALGTKCSLENTSSWNCCNRVHYFSSTRMLFLSLACCENQHIRENCSLEASVLRDIADALKQCSDPSPPSVSALLTLLSARIKKCQETKTHFQRRRDLCRLRVGFQAKDTWHDFLVFASPQYVSLDDCKGMYDEWQT